MNEAIRLLFGRGRAVLERGAASHGLQFALEGIARSFTHEPPPLHELERAIDLLEDELARVPCSLHGPGTLAIGGARLLGWAGGPVLLTREQVEAQFQLVASAALGIPRPCRTAGRSRCGRCAAGRA